MSEPVICAVDAGVAHIELNRPDAANALDLPLAKALRQAVARAAADDSVRAVLVTGAGQRFCVGGDVGSFIAAPEPSAYLHALASEADLAVRALEALTKPVVAAVHGAVAGAGLAVMLACDRVVAAEGTKLAFADTGIGLTPDCGVSYLLPRAIGSHRALGFALGGRPVDAATAQEWGMVTEVVEDAHLRARELADSLAAGPAVALGQTRRLLRAGWDADRGSTGAVEAATIAEMVAGSEAQALIERFLSR